MSCEVIEMIRKREYDELLRTHLETRAEVVELSHQLAAALESQRKAEESLAHLRQAMDEMEAVARRSCSHQSDSTH